MSCCTLLKQYRYLSGYTRLKRYRYLSCYTLLKQYHYLSCYTLLKQYNYLSCYTLLKQYRYLSCYTLIKQYHYLSCYTLLKQYRYLSCYTLLKRYRYLSCYTRLKQYRYLSCYTLLKQCRFLSCYTLLRQYRYLSCYNWYTFVYPGERATGGHTYENWDSGQPSCFLPKFLCHEDCGCLRKDEGYKWHDYGCATTGFEYGFACQFGKLLYFITNKVFEVIFTFVAYPQHFYMYCMIYWEVKAKGF